jgi:hypothetical protein
MKQIRTLIHVIKHSLFPIDDYYIKVRKQTPFSFSLKYLISLVLLSSIALTLLYPLHFLPMYQPSKLKSQIISTLKQLPEDFVLNINDFGVMTTNQSRPIIIFNQNQKAPERLLVIDPQATEKMAQDYNTRFLLMRRKAVIKSFDGLITFEYRKQRPVTFDSRTIGNITSFLEELFSFYWVFFALFMLFFLIVIPAIFVISKIFYVAIASLIVFIIVKLFVLKRLSYKKTLQIGMHASTAPILLEISSMLFHISIPIKIWFFILTLIFITAAVYEAYIEEAKPKSH